MRRPAAVSFVVAVLSLPSVATVVMRESVEQLSTRAPTIMRGTVERVSSAYDLSGRRIWTYAELTTSEVVKGRAPASATIKQPGGEVGTRGQAVAGTARLKVGDDVVLFLEPSDEPGVLVPRGLASGVVYLVRLGGTPVAVRRLDGLELAEPSSGIVVKGPQEERLGSWDELLDRVRRAAAPAAVPVRPRPGAGAVTP